MKTIKVEFHVATRYLSSEYTETVEIEVGEDATEQDIEEKLDEHLEEWVWYNIDSGFKIIEQ